METLIVCYLFVKISSKKLGVPMLFFLTHCTCCYSCIFILLLLYLYYCYIYPYRAPTIAQFTLFLSCFLPFISLFHAFVPFSLTYFYHWSINHIVNRSVHFFISRLLIHQSLHVFVLAYLSFFCARFYPLDLVDRPFVRSNNPIIQ